MPQNRSLYDIVDLILCHYPAFVVAYLDLGIHLAHAMTKHLPNIINND